MGFISDIFGGSKQPSVQNVSSLSPEQSQVMSWLGPMLQGRGINSSSYGGPLTAPLSGLQNTSLAALEQAALPTAETQAGGAPVGAANNALTSILNQGPQFSAGVFDQAVAQPMMKNFNERVIPALQSAYGPNAGGISSSDFTKNINFAAEDLGKTLAAQGANFALQNEGNIIGAANQAGGLATGGTQDLVKTLMAGQVPQANAQATLTNNYDAFLQQQQMSESFVRDLLGYGSVGTQNAVVNPGQPGFLQSMAPGIGEAGGAMGMAWMLGLL